MGGSQRQQTFLRLGSGALVTSLTTSNTPILWKSNIEEIRGPGANLKPPMDIIACFASTFGKLQVK